MDIDLDYLGEDEYLFYVKEKKWTEVLVTHLFNSPYNSLSISSIMMSLDSSNYLHGYLELIQPTLKRDLKALLGKDVILKKRRETRKNVIYRLKRGRGFIVNLYESDTDCQLYCYGIIKQDKFRHFICPIE